MTHQKIGMVLEGGASRTLYSCGVLDALLEANYLPDYLIGVSAGIAYGISYLSKQKERNWLIAEKYMADSRYMGIGNMLRDRNYYGLNFVFDEIPNRLLPFDYDAFAQYPGEVEAVVTNIKTGKPEYMKVARENTSYNVLVASCAMPVFFQPVHIEDEYYLDGGISDSIPYEHALEMGCDKLIIVLTRTRDYIKTPEKTAVFQNLIFRNKKELAKALNERPGKYNRCREHIFELEQQGKAFVMAPEDTFGIKRTEGRSEHLRPLYEEGFRMMQNRMDEFTKFVNQ
ncbi:MAG: patatin family protein [Eubacterium sp.]